MTAGDTSPFSRIVKVKDVSKEGLSMSFAATTEEQAALSKFLKIPKISGFVAHLHLHRKGSRIAVTGEVSATVTQICVVSLDEFDSEVREDVKALFDEKIQEPVDENNLDEDIPDPVMNGMIDVGLVAGEFLALGLDLYPKKPGAVFDFASISDAEPSPFSVLSRADAKKV